MLRPYLTVGLSTLGLLINAKGGWGKGSELPMFGKGADLDVLPRRKGLLTSHLDPVQSDSRRILRFLSRPVATSSMLTDRGRGVSSGWEGKRQLRLPSVSKSSCDLVWCIRCSLHVKEPIPHTEK